MSGAKTEPAEKHQKFQEQQGAGAGSEDATGTGTWLGKLLATFWPKSYKWRPRASGAAAGSR